MRLNYFLFFNSKISFECSFQNNNNKKNNKNNKNKKNRTTIKD
jgi:hypothetical protein